MEILLSSPNPLQEINRLLKNGHLLRFPHPSPLRRTAKYALLLRILGALHLAFFDQPGKDHFFSSLLNVFWEHTLDSYVSCL
jgi:hypothetical protein